MPNPKAHQTLYVVLVDDEPRIHEAIADILERAGLVSRLKHFGDPVSFLEFLKQPGTLPDLILLDVHFENSGLSGVDIIPYIRENHPYLPVVLLTGMEGGEIEEAQDFDFIYYIPKPVSPDHLVRMIRFYLGMGQKSGRRSAELSQNLADHKKQVELLRKELAEAEIASWGEPSSGRTQKKESRGIKRIVDILSAVLKNCELMPGFADDMGRLADADFSLLKRAVDTLIRFDLSESPSPGLHVHKYQGVEDVFSLRLSHKARLFFYQAHPEQKKRLIRLDPEHDTRGMDKWLKANYDSFAGP